MRLGRKDKADSAGAVTNGNGSSSGAETANSAGTLAIDTEERPPGPGPEFEVEGTPTEPKVVARHAAGSEPFGALLVRKGLVSEEDVAQALVIQHESGKRIGETLVTMGALNQRELTLFLANLLGLPVVDLRRDNPEPEALDLVPEQIVREHMAMPVRVDDDGLEVAVSDQPSITVRALLTEASDHPIRFALAPESDIQWAIDRSYQAIGGVDRLVEAFEAVEGTRHRGPRHRDRRDRGGHRRRADRPGRHPDLDPGQA